MKTKKCYRCLKRKKIADFGKYKYALDGVRNYCKVCKNQEMTAIRARDREKYVKKTQLWRERNREKHNAYYRNRRRQDLNFKLKCKLRSRLSTLVGQFKSSSALNLLGCTLDELKIYLESKFQEGMNWNNYGKWHIDHIKPCYSFDLTNQKEQKKCFHFLNLQPLWATQNLKKNKF
jgi:hypothetical protein